MIKTLIVVPMKNLSVSKTRLAGTLSNSARDRLVCLLYQKTLNFLIPIAAKEKVEIAVVTKCKYAKDIAKKLGVRVIHEPNNLGLSAAILHSAIAAKEMGFERLNFPGIFPGGCAPRTRARDCLLAGSTRCPRLFKSCWSVATLRWAARAPPRRAARPPC